MLITRKEQYALRAIYELARHRGKGPLKVSEIAEAHGLPKSFLEVILGELKRKGLVSSKRGYHGGYTLIRPPEEIMVGDIFRAVQGRMLKIKCSSCDSVENCSHHGRCTFLPMWRNVQKAVVDVYDGTSIADLLKNEGGETT